MQIQSIIYIEYLHVLYFNKRYNVFIRIQKRGKPP